MPRGRSSGVSFTLLASGIAAIALTIGAAYAVFGTGSSVDPTLGASEPASFTPTWSPDDQALRATLAQELSEPARARPAAPATAAVTPTEQEPVSAERELTGDEASLVSEPPTTSFSVVKPVAPNQPESPVIPPGREGPTQAPYPNPTTTPPEMVGPTEAAPQMSVPPVDTGNPY